MLTTLFLAVGLCQPAVEQAAIPDGAAACTRHLSDDLESTPMSEKASALCDPGLSIVRTGSAYPNTPLIVPIRNGNHVKLSSAAQGVLFDINGDGELELVAWPEEPEDVAFLAMDRDGDGAITSGRELFGDVTLEGAPNGFHALIALQESFVYEGPSALRVGRDAAFDDLLLWFDRNRDGVSQPSELEPASDYLIEISLNSVLIGKRDQHGNMFRLQGWMRLVSKPDERRPVYDVFLTVQ